MCGIAGIISLNGHEIDPALLDRLCAQLVHRGPDAQGIHVNGRAGLGQRRLSIIDLAGGRQPMSNEDGSVWVTFNGEIYNFLELRPGLEALGHRFATHSDTEVIVHAYEQYGRDCVRHFRGMFAFALWDERRQSLFLARDRVGKKPLYYAQTPGEFVFASELQAMVQHPAVSRQPDAEAIDDYLSYGYVPAPRTAFRGIAKLPPAHTLELQLRPEGGGAEPLRIESYWQLPYAPKQDLSEEEAVEGFLEVFQEAVRLRLIADVPLGALLSGGVDSSLVVAVMSRLTDRPVKTFSIGFEEQAFNELPYARAVAQRYGTDHHEMIVRPRALEILPRLVRHYGEPYADSSAIPSYYVAELTRQHVTVALNGDGGDESFAGYERYLGSALARRLGWIPRPLRHGAQALATRLIPASLPRRSRLRQARRFLEAAELPPGPRYLRWLSYFTPADKKRLYRPGFRQMLGGRNAEAWFLGELEAGRSECTEDLDLLLATDVRSYLPYDLLVKMDIATMANSLEARSPFLDHKVMEFAARLPVRYKMRGTTLKYLLKKVGSRLLPPHVLYRRKMGFGVPVGDWMRRELRALVEETLLSPRALGRGYFQPAAVRELVRGHLTGEQDHSYQLWALLWLELWHREFAP
jgi:asparagine synthase (glutamine-hydrolysing)